MDRRDALLTEAIRYLREGGQRLPLDIAAELLARGYDVTALEDKYAAAEAVDFDPLA